MSATAVVPTAVSARALAEESSSLNSASSTAATSNSGAAAVGSDSAGDVAGDDNKDRTALNPENMDATESSGRQSASAGYASAVNAKVRKQTCFSCGALDRGGKRGVSETCQPPL